MGGSNWGELFRGGLTVEQMGPVVSRVGNFVEVAGKSLGWVGVGTGVGQTVEAFYKGDEGRGLYGVGTTALGLGAMFAPPPINLACGSAALAMGGAELLYDKVPAVRDFVDGGVDVIEGTVGAVGDGVSATWDAVTDLF
jgi:hypothetical protein